MDYESTLLTEIYNAECVEEYLPYALADPDFPEQYGPNEIEEVFYYNPPLHKAPEASQQKYKDNFQTYGVTRSRLEE